MNFIILNFSHFRLYIPFDCKFIAKAQLLNGNIIAVQNLTSNISENTLIANHKEMDGKKAKGIDGVAKEDYIIHLKANVEHLVKRMKSGSYKPEPIRRVYIPKDRNNKKRPLGISCYEHKLVENVLAQILAMVYEPKFYNDSFGFRPNRNCHQAVREVIEMVQYRKVNYVVEADKNPSLTMSTMHG